MSARYSSITMINLSEAEGLAQWWQRNVPRTSSFASTHTSQSTNVWYRREWAELSTVVTVLPYNQYFVSIRHHSKILHGCSTDQFYQILTACLYLRINVGIQILSIWLYFMYYTVFLPLNSSKINFKNITKNKKSYIINFVNIKDHEHFL